MKEFQPGGNLPSATNPNAQPIPGISPQPIRNSSPGISPTPNDALIPECGPIHHSSSWRFGKPDGKSNGECVAPLTFKVGDNPSLSLIGTNQFATERRTLIEYDKTRIQRRLE